MKTYFYMLSLCLYGSSLMAQSPGGIGGASLKLWIKADAGTTATGTALDSWTYQNNTTNAFTASGAERPTLNPNAINFRPGVVFSGAQFMNGTPGSAPLTAGDDDYSVFGVWTTTGAPGAPQRIWSQRNPGGGFADGTGLWLYSGNYGNQAEIGNGGYVHLTTRPYAAGWNITQYNLLNQPTGDFQTFDDRNLTGAAPINTDLGSSNGPALRTLSDVQNALGGRDFAGQEPFNGTLSELIVYDRPITDPAERLQIFSYLAIKYGLNLNSNLVSSTGATVWNNSLLPGYTNGVFGIGVDAGSGLNTNISNSITTAGEINLTVSNPMGIIDGEYLLIGHNGGSSNEGSGEVPASAVGSLRIDRKWLVQHTGDVGPVRLAFDISNSTFTGSTALLRDFRLVVDTDGDGDLSTGVPVYYFPLSLTTAEVSFNNVVLPTGSVIGLISNASAALPVTWKSFTGEYKNGSVKLNWAVENNENGDRYEVEHSTDGKSYKVIGVVDNKTDVKAYSFSTDNYANGANYYRVHQIDLDGQDIYSKVYTVTINTGADFSFKVVNNPVKTNALKLQVRSATAVQAAVEIWSLAGVQVVNKQQNIDAGSSTITVPLNNVPAGSYVVKLRQNGITRTAGIIKL